MKVSVAKPKKSTFLVVGIIFVSAFVIFISQAIQKNRFTILNRAQEPSSPQSAPVRGVGGDEWADVILGKRNFKEISQNEVVPYRLSAPGGVLVAESLGREVMYIWDSGNSRVLGFDLQKCLNSDKACKADVVLGQPSGYDHGSCNQNGSFETYPHRGPASPSTLCGIPEWTHTIREDKSFNQMATDSEGNLYVPDTINNRILKFNNPFVEDTIADEVWGQADFSGNHCNRHENFNSWGRPDFFRSTKQPSTDTLCFLSMGNGSFSIGFGVAIDGEGNMWVADGGNNRVVRFPNYDGEIQKRADMVLGQNGFTVGTRIDEKTEDLSKIHNPMSLVFDKHGALYIADSGNDRVLVFDDPQRAVTLQQADRAIALEVGYPISLTLAENGEDIYIFSEVREEGTNPHNRVSLLKEGEVTELIQRKGILGGGGIGVDKNGGILLSRYNGTSDVEYYEKMRGSNVYKMTQSLFSQERGYNMISDRRFDTSGWAGTTTLGNQLFAVEGRKMRVWNDKDQLVNGQPPDFIIEAAEPRTGDHNYYNVKSDDSNHLYVIRGTEIDIYEGPIKPDSYPTKTISGLYPTIDGPGLSVGDVDLLSGIAPAPDGSYLWVADVRNNRVFRVSKPLTEDHYIDIILGQPDVYQNTCHFVNVLTSMCFPGSVALDNYENLYVTNHFIEDEGYHNILMFKRELFEDVESLVLFPPATKLFPSGDISDNTSLYHTFQPSFKSNNDMIVGNNAYSGRRFVDIYRSPEKYDPDNPESEENTLPSWNILNDYTNFPVATHVDEKDNVYVFDINRSQLRIYYEDDPDELSVHCSIDFDLSTIEEEDELTVNVRAESNQGAIDTTSVYYREKPDSGDGSGGETAWKPFGYPPDTRSKVELPIPEPTLAQDIRTRDDSQVPIQLEDSIQLDGDGGIRCSDLLSSIGLCSVACRGSSCGGSLDWKDTYALKEGTYEFACEVELKGSSEGNDSGCDALDCGRLSKNYVEVKSRTDIPNKSIYMGSRQTDSEFLKDFTYKKINYPGNKHRITEIDWFEDGRMALGSSYMWGPRASKINRIITFQEEGGGWASPLLPADIDSHHVAYGMKILSDKNEIWVVSNSNDEANILLYKDEKWSVFKEVNRRPFYQVIGGFYGLDIDQTKRIWALGNGGLIGMSPDGDTKYYYEYHGIPKYYRLLDVLVTSNNDVYVLSRSRETSLNKYNRATDRWEPVCEECKSIYMLREHPNCTIWGADSGNLYSIRDDELTSTTTFHGINPRSGISDFAIDGFGNMWLAEGRGWYWPGPLYYYDRSDGSNSKFVQLPDFTDRDEFITSIESFGKTVAIGTSDGDVHTYTYKKKLEPDLFRCLRGEGEGVGGGIGEAGVDLGIVAELLRESDINEDGVVNTIDVRLLFEALGEGDVGGGDGDGGVNGDVNGDGKIDALDVSVVIANIGEKIQ